MQQRTNRTGNIRAERARNLDVAMTQIAGPAATVSRFPPLAGALRRWYWLSAPTDPAPNAPFAVRERARRGRLLSVILLGLLAILLGGFYQYGVVDTDHPLMVLILGVALGACIVVMALNRLGQVPLAGVLTVLLTEVPLAGPFAATKDGRLDILHLGVFYLTVGALLVAASVLSPWSVFLVALFNCLASFAILQLLPHTPALAALLASNDGQQAFLGPMVMQVIVAIVAYLWAHNTLAALRRADRAEEIAALELREIERQRDLEEGVRQLLAVHIHLANGDFAARAPELRNPMLWQVGKSLNMLIARLGRYAQAETVIRREQEEAQRLAQALYMSHAGRPVIWPSPTGLPLDVVIAAVRDSGPRGSGPGTGSQSVASTSWTPPGYSPPSTQSSGWIAAASQAPSPPDTRGELPDWLQP